MILTSPDLRVVGSISRRQRTAAHPVPFLGVTLTTKGMSSLNLEAWLLAVG
jgi:hypothetical protein